MRGIIAFYINYASDSKPSEQELIEMIKKQNKELLDKFKSEGYEIMFFPVVGESSRIERVDFK